MDIGKAVMIVLREKGMKKQDLAEQLDVTPATVSSICKGTGCSGRMLKKLSKVFDMKVSELISIGE
jgi:plasmid maintenance system antidote protein VapI